MDKDITYYAQTRHAAKAFDPEKKISQEDLEKVKTLLQTPASSVNLQPWHFIIASTDEGKARISKGTDPSHPFNTKSILSASHVVVFCSKTKVDEDYMSHVLVQEEKDGRYKEAPEKKEHTNAVRTGFTNFHKNTLNDVEHWMAKQTYLNLGAFLLGVSALGLDAAPMEGFDPEAINKEFGLDEKGYTALAIVPIGYNDPEHDGNARLPKSRLPFKDIMTEI